MGGHLHSQIPKIYVSSVSQLLGCYDAGKINHCNSATMTLLWSMYANFGSDEI